MILKKVEKPFDKRQLKDILTDFFEGDWIDEYCPECNAQLLGNNAGDKWCSYVNCTYGIKQN